MTQLNVTAAPAPRQYPLLAGAFLVVLAGGLILVASSVGTETYPYIDHRITYRFPFATLDRVYLIALAILAVHNAAYIVHFLTVGARQQAVTPPPPLVFSPTKFVITWFFLIGLAGAYAVGASIATPALFDTVFGPARDTAFVRVWNHTYFGFLLLASLVAGVIYLSLASARRRGAVGAFHWVADLLSLASGHRFIGVVNWILLLGLISNIATGLFILGAVPLIGGPLLPLHSYGLENIARLAHDTGTAFIIASFSGQIYLRLLPARRWMLKTMFGGYEAET